MARTVSIGAQDFEKIISNNNFYIDKKKFIKEWWESNDIVTLITRPRRFGKTLNLNMIGRFFSVKFSGQGAVFEGLTIWKEEKYRKLQGTYPVIFLSFAGVKANHYIKTYWVNTSSNELVSSLLTNGGISLKMQFEELLKHHSIVCEIDEEIVYDQLGQIILNKF